MQEHSFVHKDRTPDEANARVSSSDAKQRLHCSLSLYLFGWGLFFFLWLLPTLVFSQSLPASEPSTAPASMPATSEASTPTKKETTPTPVAKEAFFAPGQLVSFLPFSLRRAGFSFQYERPLASQRYSLAAGLGMRFGARDPNRSLAVSLGVEGKRWLGKTPQFAESGFYLMARIDVAENRLQGEDGLVGASFVIEENFGPGFRWVIAKKVELGFAGTLAIRSEFEHKGILPPIHSGSVALWSYLGWFW